jgi:hypothetical protein
MSDTDRPLIEQSADQAIRALLQPVIELDSELALQEDDLLKKLDNVRDERRRLRGVLRAADPSMTPAKPGPKGTRPGVRTGERLVPYTISEAKVERVREIVAGFEGEFSSNDVKEHLNEGTETAQKDTINKALHRLRERGQIRLISVKRGRAGGYTYIATERIHSSAVESSQNGATAP